MEEESLDRETYNCIHSLLHSFHHLVPNTAGDAGTAAVPTVLAGLAQRAENRCLEWVSANFEGSNGKVFSFSGHTIFVTIVQPCH